MRAARRRVEDWRGAAASDTVCAGRDVARAAASFRKGPDVPSQGLDLVGPVMYLSWTDDVPVVYPPYTCAGNAPDHEAARSACGCCERGARAAEVDLA
jgi:hypothetical protein